MLPQCVHPGHVSKCRAAGRLSPEAVLCGESEGRSGRDREAQVAEENPCLCELSVSSTRQRDVANSAKLDRDGGRVTRNRLDIPRAVTIDGERVRFIAIPARYQERNVTRSDDPTLAA